MQLATLATFGYKKWREEDDWNVKCSHAMPCHAMLARSLHEGHEQDCRLNPTCMMDVTGTGNERISETEIR